MCSNRLELLKQDNDAIAEAFSKRLKQVAGFQFVPEPLPMRNSNNAVVYYLFFASQKPAAKNIIEDIFKKYREVLNPRPIHANFEGSPSVPPHKPGTKSAISF
jgi:hypothetical protein